MKAKQSDNAWVASLSKPFECEMRQAKGEVMASVKRFIVDSSRGAGISVFPDGDFVLASDYDRLVEVCMELMESPGRNPCTCEWEPQRLKQGLKCMWCSNKAKALALIGEGGEEAK